MNPRKGLRTVCLMILAAGGLASVSVVAVGCNTAQTPSHQVNDTETTTRVKAKLAADLKASSLTNIDVNTTNGVVTLAGQVENLEVKQKAETLTASVHRGGARQ